MVNFFYEYVHVQELNLKSLKVGTSSSFLMESPIFSISNICVSYLKTKLMREIFIEQPLRFFFSFFLMLFLFSTESHIFKTIL